MATAFYEPCGTGRFRSTGHTVGPWDAGLQHAGPPSALLARALETAGSWPGTIARIGIDILGAVPVAEVGVRTRVLRPGRSVELLQAELDVGGRAALRAQAWRIRADDLNLPAAAVGTDTAGEDTVPAFPPAATAFFDWPGGYLRAMEWRPVGELRAASGEGTVWARMRVPLIADEEPSGLQRVLTLADSGNGVSHAVPIEQWVFVNTELTVHLAAVPAGEWICLDARTRIDRQGFGLASSRLFDRQRLVGRGAQTLYVRRRA